MDFLIKKLIDLKQNHGILGVKSEFEDEGASFEEISLLKNITSKAGLDLTIKIGGCGALNDINKSKKLEAHSIVAPMIESSYAVKKFINSVNTIYTEEKPELFINIETITGYQNFDEILSIKEAKSLTGVVVGRFDLAKSIDLECKDIHSDRIFGLVNDLAIKTQKARKILTIGGGVSLQSLDFFNKLPPNSLERFETRKIIFDFKNIEQENLKSGIIKAIEFELLWLKYKQKAGMLNPNDLNRIALLEKRCKTCLV